MNLIRRALDSPMSQGLPEFFPDIFGQFLASVVAFEVCGLLHFWSKSAKKHTVKPQKCIKVDFTLLKSLLLVA